VVYLGLGSNLGNRLDQLRQAIFALATHPEISVTAVSRIYESAYVGPGVQPPYLNGCVEIETPLPPEVLLTVLKGTEARQGRRPGSHLQPRTIDLDILLYGQRSCRGHCLTLPHPGLRQRAFVLEPLRDIAPDLRIPDSTETVASACARIRREEGPWVHAYRDDSLLPGLWQQGKEDWRAALAVHSR
jgi:2-amino-4-hydroxy-6-hydroxymethyldihydropteridine diphosphokinase